MKTLRDYIIESTSPEENAEQLAETKTFKFDFSRFENANETVKAIVSSAEGYVSNESETSFTLSFSKADATKLSGVLEIIRSFLKKEAHTPKRSSDENFAQYCAKQERLFGKMETFVTKTPEPIEQPNVNNGEDNNDEDEKE